MPSQLVGPTEAFGAAGELAAMWLLARVCSYVPGLMFQTVEGLIAEGAFVGTRQVLSFVFGESTHQGRQRPDGCGHPAGLPSISSFLMMPLLIV